MEETKRAGMEALDSILVGLTPVKEEKPGKQAKHMRTVEDDDATRVRVAGRLNSSYVNTRSGASVH